MRFTQTIHDCVPVASIHTDGAFGSVVGFTTVGSTSFTQVGIHIYSLNGTPLDSAFDVIVAC